MSTKTAHQPRHMGQTNIPGAGERYAAPANTNSGREEQFRLTQTRAYGLWEQAGKPIDDESRERFWHEAEKVIPASCSGGV
jgi:hypothetical protein